MLAKTISPLKNVHHEVHDWMLCQELFEMLDIIGWMRLSYPDHAVGCQDWVIYDKIWTTSINSEETSRVMNIIQGHLNFIKRHYKIASDIQLKLSKAVADRDYLQNIVETANAFKKAHATDAITMAEKIASLVAKIIVNPLSEELPAEKAKLEEELKLSQTYANVSTVEAYKFGITDAAELAELDRRFDKRTVEDVLNIAEKEVQKLKVDLQGANDDREAILTRWATLSTS